MAELRRYAIMIVIAALFAVLVFSTIDAFAERPEYSDFCEEEFYPIRGGGVECPDAPQPADEDVSACREQEGQISYKYDGNGCAESYYCSTCQHEYDTVRERHDTYRFFAATILAIIGIIVGLTLPKKEELNEWIGSGLMIGGLIVIFIATGMYWESLYRQIRPLVILIELALVIFLAYKKLRK